MKKNAFNQKNMYSWKLHKFDNFLHSAIWHNGLLCSCTRNISPLPLESIEAADSFTEIPVFWKYWNSIHRNNVLQQYDGECFWKLRKGIWVPSRKDKIKMY